MQDSIAIVLAGGIGSRLSPLTDERAKPAVPFGGKYRIIDFTLTNCLHSGLRRILVLTQYKSHSLHKHVRDGWSVFNPELGEYVTVVPPQMRNGNSWYQGTADAIYQNLWLLSRSDAKYVVVLSGDHIYKMDYAAMLAQHKRTGAELTIASMQVKQAEASEFGVMSIEESGLVTGFAEKPSEPAPLPGTTDQSLVSMGVYIFSTEVLQQALIEDAEHPRSEHDFGKDIIPKLIDKRGVYAYQFGDELGRVAKDSYWRDVGTIDSYYQANMDLLEPVPPMNLYQPDWAVRTYEAQYPPARTVSSATGNEGIFINSIIANGVVNAGGSVHSSIVFSNVQIRDHSTVSNCIIFDDVDIGEGCQLRNCIIDRHVKVPAQTNIGINPREDAKRFHVSANGIVVIPKHYCFGDHSQL